MKRSIKIAVFSMCIILLSLPLYAQISPGKLSTFHKDLEGISNCTKCHELGKEVSDVKCLDCHIAINDRTVVEKGYHSSSDVLEKRCSECHSEHHGLEFELIHWKEGQQNFDHSLTGYNLEGKHQISECENCHKVSYISKDVLKSDEKTDIDRTLLGLNGSACISCHHDEHGNQLTNSCLDCHGYDGWIPTTGFDHNSTKYPLKSKHLDLDCVKCHKPVPVKIIHDSEMIQKKNSFGEYIQYSNLDFKNCSSCHEDPHKGKLGVDCKVCHQVSGFQNILGDMNDFDHSKTTYPLEGSHKDVECSKCHVSGKLTTKIRHQFCSDCHQDEHQQQFTDREDAGACESCHSVDSFLPSNYEVEQHQKSKFPLTGSHLATPCIVCHVEIEINGENCARFDFPDLSCESCHENIHGEEANRWIANNGCEYCHTTDSWHTVDKFDHGLSKFKLVDKHKEVACNKCHRRKDEQSGTIKTVLQPIEMSCLNCHEDIHLGQFVRTEIGEIETECERCHSSKGWNELKFEHNRDSRFILDGVHLTLECNKCHKEKTGSKGDLYTLYKPLGIECADCHGANIPIEDK
jgi:hypothetical protein